MNPRQIAAFFVFVSTIVSFGVAAAKSSATGPGHGPWRDVSSESIAEGGARFLIPMVGRTVAIDWPTLEGQLIGAPSDVEPDANDRGITIEVPRPGGGFSSFKIVESPVMAPELAARYPYIRTYRGQGLDDPSETIRCDTTPHGFHAMVLSPSGTWFVDPYQTDDRVNHISYFKRDLADIHARFFQCSVDGEVGSVPDGLPPATGSSRSGEILRTYRVAVACTGEYTIFHGGTVADGLAAIVTAMNRVNAIYEREVAIRMVLVANNDLIVYTDPATDPYSNSNGGAMLAQHQLNLTAVIGPEH